MERLVTKGTNDGFASWVSPLLQDVLNEGLAGCIADDSPLCSGLHTSYELIKRLLGFLEKLHEGLWGGRGARTEGSKNTVTELDEKPRRGGSVGAGIAVRAEPEKCVCRVMHTLTSIVGNLIVDQDTEMGSPVNELPGGENRSG